MRCPLLVGFDTTLFLLKKKREEKEASIFLMHLGGNDEAFVRSAPSRASRPCSFFHLQMSVFQLLRVLLEESRRTTSFQRSVVVGEDGFSV